MKKENNKNGFLITWVSCIVFLLMLCFLGVKGTHSACTYVPSSGTYVGDCSGGYTDDNLNSSKPAGTGTNKPAGTGTNKPADTGGSCMTTHPGSNYTCSYYYANDGKTMCYSCTPKSSSSSSKPAGTGGSCMTTHPGNDYICSYYYANDGKTMCYDCTKKPSDYCTTTHPGSDYTCSYHYNNEGKMCYDCQKKESPNNSCMTTHPGNDYICSYYYANDGKTMCYDCTKKPSDYCTTTHPGSNYSCSYYYANDGKTICYDNCTENRCSTGTHAVVDENGKIKCVADCLCEEGECSEDKYACWNCSGSYYWGLETQYSNCNYSSRDKNNCSGTGAKPSNPNKPFTPSTPQLQPSNSNPIYSKPVDSNPTYSKPASSSNNVTENPATGQIAMFIIWIVGLAAVVYSVWYFKNIKKEN